MSQTSNGKSDDAGQQNDRRIALAEIREQLAEIVERLDELQAFHPALRVKEAIDALDEAEATR